MLARPPLLLSPPVVRCCLWVLLPPLHGTRTRHRQAVLPSSSPLCKPGTAHCRTQPWLGRILAQGSLITPPDLAELVVRACTICPGRDHRKRRLPWEIRLLKRFCARAPRLLLRHTTMPVSIHEFLRRRPGALWVKFVAHVALAPRGADPCTPPLVRGTRRPLTGRVRAAGRPAHRARSSGLIEGCWTLTIVDGFIWEIVRTFGFSSIKLAQF